MIRRLVFFVVAFCLTPSALLAQSNDTGEYLPLKAGNSWTYIEIIDAPYAEPDTVWLGPYVASDAISVNDTLYHVLYYPSSFADTLRADSEGRIWARIGGADELLFDFTLDSGETYSVGEYEVTVQREDTVTVAAGQFVDPITILFDIPDAVDDERSFTFAEGVGIISAFGTAQVNDLYSAQIDGVHISPTTVDEGFLYATFHPTVYPNPVNGTARIVVSTSAHTDVNAVVYDMLGREVSDLGKRRCDVEGCEFEWDGSGLPNGVYMIRVRQGALERTLKVVKSR